MSSAGTVLELKFPSLASLAFDKSCTVCVFKTFFERLRKTATEREHCKCPGTA